MFGSPIIVKGKCPILIKEITLEDGTVIQEYVVGYSIEDFLKDFY